MALIADILKAKGTDVPSTNEIEPAQSSVAVILYSKQNRPNTMAKLVDVNGELCGYLTLFQIDHLIYRPTIEGETAHLAITPTLDVRLKMLRASFLNPCLTEDQRLEIQHLISVLLQARITSSKLQFPDDEALITRDSRGLVVGLFTNRDASSRWQNVVNRGPIALINVSTSIDETAALAKEPIPFETGYSPRVQKSLALGMDYAASMTRQRWIAGRSGLIVNVLYRNNNPICTAMQGTVEKYFGNRWFIVAFDTIQLVTNWDENRVKYLAKCAAEESRMRHVLGLPGTYATPLTEPKPKKDNKTVPAKRENNRTEQDNTAKTKPKKTLYVRDIHGRTIYQCGRRKGTQVKQFLIEKLPVDAYQEMTSGLVLTKSLLDLGFESQADFVYFCAHKGRRRPNQQVKQQPKEIATFTIRSRGNGAMRASYQEEVSFDDQNNTLYICKGTIACRRKGHTIMSATGIVAKPNHMPCRINVNYCQNCQMYFISEHEFRHYQEDFGILLGHFRFRGFTFGSSLGDMAKLSPLVVCGYTVNQKDDLSPDDRRVILANIIDRGILSKDRVIDYLTGFISLNSRRYDREEACARWEDDLEWVRRYRMNSQRHFIVDRVKVFH